jgi:hypothetical protein
MDNLSSTYLTLYAPPGISVEAQRAALAQPNTRDGLARNSYLTLDPEVWLDLWNPKPPVDQATSLVSRPLTSSQVEFVVEKERRVSVITALIENNFVPQVQLVKLLGVKALKVRVAECALEYENTHPGTYEHEFVTEMLRYAGGLSLLDALATSRFDDAACVELLKTFATWAPSPGWKTSLKLARLLHLRPGLLHLFTQEEALPAMLQAAAGSQLLAEEVDQRRVLKAVSCITDTERARFILMSLAANPRLQRPVLGEVISKCSGEPDLGSVSSNAERRLQNWEKAGTVSGPYEEVNDEATIERLVRRATPFTAWDGSSSRCKPFELAALAKNPNLTEAQVSKVHSALYSFDVEEALGEEVTQVSKILARNFPALELDIIETSDPDVSAGHTPGRTPGHTREGYAAPEQLRDYSDELASWLGRNGWRQDVDAVYWVHNEASNLSAGAWSVLFGLIDSAEHDTFKELISAARSIAGTT